MNKQFDYKRFWSDFAGVMVLLVIYLVLIAWIFHDRPITFFWRIVIVVMLPSFTGILKLYKKDYWI
jgi:hypothetical protein